MPSDPATLAPTDQALLDFLASRDVPCPACSYNLRALTQPRCPECAEPLRLQISEAPRPLAPWLAIVVPLCLAAGLGALLLFLALVKFYFSGSTGSLPLASAIPAFLAIPMAVLSLLTRRRILCLPQLTRRILTHLCLAWLVFSIGLLLH